jgi:hypothetical protein
MHGKEKSENKDERLFSQREGFKPVKSKIQDNFMDDDLRNSLWNALYKYYWSKVKGITLLDAPVGIRYLCEKLWTDYFKKPLDTLNLGWIITFQEIKEYFFQCPWYEVYDFIEFIANNSFSFLESTNNEFIKYCNHILERELSAYRFVGKKLVKITSECEISEIEEALNISAPLKGVNIHLQRALDLLADRKNPDYRNSIKESISAIEAICRIITGDEKATLGKALQKIEEKSQIKLHPALKEAFNKLYGYTSDADGIRHSLLDETNISFEDAKFMLVSCSAFINYLIAKASKSGMLKI